MMDNPKKFWDNRYSEASYTYGTKPNLYFKNQLDALPNPGRLLLLAEGEGRNAVYAAQKGWEVTAIDFSEKGKQKAQALAAQNGVEIEYIVANLQTYDFIKTGPWDAIGLIYAHFSSEFRGSIHRKCAKALRPGGHIILEAFNRKQFNRLSGGPKDLDMLYSKILLEEDFESLDYLEGGESTVFLTEGEGHAGLADVVRYLSQKRPFQPGKKAVSP